MAISAKAITISTVGVVPGIRRFTEQKRPYRLGVSLTSADPSRRAELLPIERTYPTHEVVEALREYHAATGQRVILAWVMISGFNTREEDARQLAELTAGLPIKIDLIDVNDPSGRFVPPSPQELNAFRDLSEPKSRSKCSLPADRSTLKGLAITTEGFGRIGKAIGEIGLPTLLVQEGGYLSDELGANLTSFINGFDVV